MTLDVSRSDLTLGIVGTGIMGRGIAQIAAQAGIQVLLFDAQPNAANAARDFISSTFAKLTERGRLSHEAANETLGRLHVAAELADLAACQVIVEAIVERLDAKQSLFKQLEGIVASDCLLASNTSSLQVTSIAAGCKHPERVGGFHFFNPVPLMKVVEVIDGVLSAPWVGDALSALARRMGHTPVRARDTPGFIVNHAGRGFGTEALQIIREGIAEFYEVDRLLRDVAGFRMGPFELLDLTGLDVSHPVMESIYDQYYQEPRYRPSPLTGQRLVAGLLGRKSNNRGFYSYADGQQQAMPAPPAPRVAVPEVWISPSGLGQALHELAAKLGATFHAAAKPAHDSLCLIAPLGQDATTAALAQGLDPRHTVAVDCLLDTSKRRTLMTTPITLPTVREAAHALLARDGVPVSVIHDSPGFVAQRVLAHIINIGCDIAQQRIATPADIDRAVTLGLGYPHGPLAWGDAIGAERVLAILDALHEFYGDPRYRASPWLKRRALLGVSLLTAET